MVGENKIKFDYFAYGEGDPVSGGDAGNYLAGLETDLWVSVPFAFMYVNYTCVAQAENCYPNPDESRLYCIIDQECEEAKEISIEYDNNSKENIEKAFEILKTFKWEKVN